MRIDNIRKAMIYLNQHGYQKLGNDGRNKVSFIRTSGDGSWQDEAAPNNRWEELRKDRCCLVAENDRRANYCSDCGNGINRFVSYIRLEEEPHRKPSVLVEEAELPR